MKDGKKLNTFKLKYPKMEKIVTLNPRLNRPFFLVAVLRQFANTREKIEVKVMKFKNIIPAGHES